MKTKIKTAKFNSRSSAQPMAAAALISPKDVATAVIQFVNMFRPSAVEEMLADLLDRVGNLEEALNAISYDLAELKAAMKNLPVQLNERSLWGVIETCRVQIPAIRRLDAVSRRTQAFNQLRELQQAENTLARQNYASVHSVAIAMTLEVALIDLAEWTRAERNLAIQRYADYFHTAQLPDAPYSLAAALNECSSVMANLLRECPSNARFSLGRVYDGRTRGGLVGGRGGAGGVEFPVIYYKNGTMLIVGGLDNPLDRAITGKIQYGSRLEADGDEVDPKNNAKAAEKKLRDTLATYNDVNHHWLYQDKLAGKAKIEDGLAAAPVYEARARALLVRDDD